MSDRAIETTDANTECFRKFSSASSAIGSKFLCARDAFNTLSPMPKGAIDLGDGRELLIRGWVPKGTLDAASGYLLVEIEAFITLKEQPEPEKPNGL